MPKKSDYPQFETELEELCEGLIYVSETDSDVRPIIGKTLRESSIAGYIGALGIEKAERVELTDAKEFFGRLTKIRDWHGTRERSLANAWMRLEAFMDANLTQLKVLKNGRVRIDIYVVGVDPYGRIAGVKMRSVET